MYIYVDFIFAMHIGASGGGGGSRPPNTSAGR